MVFSNTAELSLNILHDRCKPTGLMRKMAYLISTVHKICRSIYTEVYEG